MKSSRDNLPSLLLLPCPPEPASKETLSAAYRPALEAAISRVKDPSKAAVLVVAVAAPLLSGQFQHSKTLSWARAQSLLAGVYGVASVACARLSIAAHVSAGPGSVDVRVVLVDHHARAGRAAAASLSSSVLASDPRPTAVEPNNTAVVDLATFASAYHPWAAILHSSSEAGLALNAEYLRLAEGRQVLRQEQLVAVDGGVTMHVPPSEQQQQQHHHHHHDRGQRDQTKLHKIVCLGGTFDHLHAGHKLLLTAGALLLDVPRTGRGPPPKEEEEVAPCLFLIGVTGDELLCNKKYAEQVQPWTDRARGVVDFLSTVLELRPEGWKGHGSLAASPNGVVALEEEQKEKKTAADDDDVLRATFRGGALTVECFTLHDAFGPTVTRREVSSLVVSAETRSGGKAVNDKREELGWPPLEVFEVDVLDAVDYDGQGDGGGDGADGAGPPTSTADSFASKISSTAIRKAEAEAEAKG